MKAKTNAVLIIVALLAYWIGLCNASAFYDAGMQRWLNRDPIQEIGGINLFAYVEEDSVNEIDPFGFDDANKGGGITVSNPYKDPTKILKDAGSVAKQVCKDTCPAIKNAGTAAGLAGTRVITGVVDGAKTGPGLTAIAYIKKMCNDCYNCLSGLGKYEDCPASNCDTPCKICNDAKNRMSGPINRL